MDPIIEKIDRLAGEIAPITNYDGRARADLAKCALDTLQEIKRASYSSWPFGIVKVGE